MAKSSMWNLRIDEVCGVTREIVTKWCADNGAYLCVRETSDTDSKNPHYHIAVKLPAVVTAQTMRDRLRTMFNVPNGRGDYATAVWDGSEDLLRYFCKGPEWPKAKAGLPYEVGVLPDVVFTALFETVDVRKYMIEFWETNTKKGEEVKKKNIARNVAEEMLSEGWDRNKCILERDLMMSTACAKLMAAFNGRVNDYVFYPHYQEVLYILSPSMVVVCALDRMKKKMVG